MQFRTVSICDPLHVKEMQNKNKNNCKVTKVPTAKLIEIAVANCKNGHRIMYYIPHLKNPVIWLVQLSVVVFNHAR